MAESNIAPAPLLKLPESAFPHILALMDEYSRAAVLAERERCAKVCEELEGFCSPVPNDYAAAIRKG